MVLALLSDLAFGSRIAEVAKTLGVPCHVARTLPAALGALRAAAEPPSLVLVDMTLRGGGAAEAVRALRAEPATASASIVAWYPHVDEAAGEAARAAGASRVMTRGQLDRKLAELLSGAGA
jgi:CheY-like chemotaxis protein